MLLAVAAAVASITTAVAGNASAASHASKFGLAGDTKGVTVTSETDYPDGTALVHYRKNGVDYEASGLNGSIITFKPAKAASGSTGSTMVLTMPSTVNAAGVKTRGSGGMGAASRAFAQQHGMSLRAASPNDLGASCETPSGAGGYFCDDISLVADHGGGDWTVSDTLSATGSNILLIEGEISRPAPNQLVQWSPTSDVHPSACTPYSFGFSYQGVSVSTTTSVCPDKMGPWDVSQTSFGLEWGRNCCTTATGGFGGVDVFHNPPGQNWGVAESANSVF